MVPIGVFSRINLLAFRDEIKHVYSCEKEKLMPRGLLSALFIPLGN